MMAVPIFTFSLNHKLLPGRVTIGKYDGTHSCFTAATAADKVLVHSPHRRVGLASGRVVPSDANKELALLNINQSVLSICAGNLDVTEERDTLVVGTPTNLLAYDVENNTDIFYKEVSDGSSVVIIGKLGSFPNPLAIVGGNCSLQGFDYEGNDPFWTVTGDNVCSLALLDFDHDGENELIVGSEDFDIRVFKEDNIINEQTETEAVTALAAFQSNKFGYGLANGTVGVYEKLQRLWRVKSKNRAVAIYGYDLNGDGVEELITGWSNGKIDARNSRTGEVIFKDNLNHSIAGIVEGDYRLSGKSDLICCSVEGEVRGYNLLRQVNVQSHMSGGTANVETEVIRDLFTKKQALLLELRNYEGNSQFSEICAGDMGQQLAVANQHVGIIPAQTRLQTGVAINMGTEQKPPHVEISLSTNNETIISAVMVFAEGIFEGETHVLHPKDSEVTSRLDVALYPPRDVPVDIHIKALVGYEGSQHYHVFELTRQLPRFSMYAVLAERTQDVDSFVSFVISERLQRIAMWINQNFLLMADYEVQEDLNITFLSLRDNTEVTLSMESSGHMEISTRNMALAGDIIQSLATFLNLQELQVSANFPEEQEKIGELLQKVSALQDVRLRLGAEMADHSGLIRSLVVRAEDARHLDDMKSMRKWYLELNDVNTDMIRGYNIRCKNHQELLESLRQLNVIIQKAARLRVGKYKTNIVNLCRTALKNNNLNSLVKIMKNGEA
ncbi:Bardet-Biedl syndrome 2 protein-like protein [Cryptotermes secundus]|uniref:Bardet-Biedl syndrome 2 protein homolog n=2 Tax=Cryptotermes secundus TaxID=105785 RepID=A0A2J7RNG3_9NEOP|nr:Bardet-Biedl syndrome 2 protein homolog isoform X2 [Cryptotermes secundus]PNF42358.1 Bardet-Biedl syndrome 2 protein-like protein [Cryptotermes secundus]